MNPTLYDILGVSTDAPREEIRKAWRDAADRFEPGEGGSTKQFRLFNQAAEVLLDPERRKEYDAQLGLDHDAAEQPSEPAGAEAAGAQAVSLEKTAAAESEARSEADEPKGGSKAGAAAGPASSAKPQGAAPKPKVGPEADEPKAGPKAAAAPALDAPIPGATGLATAPVATALAATPEGEGEADVEAGSASSGGRSFPTWALAVLGAVTAVAVGVAAFLVVRADRAEAYQESLNRAPAAAESAAAAVLSYKYDSLQADRDAAAKFLTDKYRKQYVDTFDKLVTPNATKEKATVQAQVLASSAMVEGQDRDPDKVPVLLFVNQSTTSTANGGQPSVALNRVRFDMVKQDGTWLVDGITSY